MDSGDFTAGGEAARRKKTLSLIDPNGQSISVAQKRENGKERKATGQDERASPDRSGVPAEWSGLG